VSEAISAGVAAIGENRVQEAEQKKPLVRGQAEWHLIGHLQTNKVARALEIFDFVQSIDRARLIRALDARAAATNGRVRGLVEVNVAAESAKTGAAVEELFPLLEAAQAAQHVEVVGLMAMGPLTDDERALRAAFARVRALGEEAARRGLLARSGEGVQLSMGMSDDFEAAILEGSTIVRIGRALFGERAAQTAG
jgi:pyridoxal phosphate enzyme (YggS family)